MEENYGTGVEDQLKKAVRDAEKVGDGVKKGFADAVSSGKAAAERLGVDGQAVADGARAYAETARKKAGKAADRMTAYADDHTALVAVAAFGVGQLVGFLATRKR